MHHAMRVCCIITVAEKVTLNATSAYINDVMISRHSLCDHCHDKMGGGGPSRIWRLFYEHRDFV